MRISASARHRSRISAFQFGFRPVYDAVRVVCGRLLRSIPRLKCAAFCAALGCPFVIFFTCLAKLKDLFRAKETLADALRDDPNAHP